MGRADLKLGPVSGVSAGSGATIPSAPRCKMCTSPFGPPGGPIAAPLRQGALAGESQVLRRLLQGSVPQPSGAEIECTLLFADIRGSTSSRRDDARHRLPRAARSVLRDRRRRCSIEHEAIVDKFVGDEVIGIFIPALAGGNHAGQAIEASLDLLRATGHETDAPWAPIGIGVNTGEAFVGVVGTADHVEFTALGDNVNITARLASAAGAGEVLVTRAAANAAELAERRAWSCALSTCVVGPSRRTRMFFGFRTAWRSSGSRPRRPPAPSLPVGRYR